MSGTTAFDALDALTALWSAALTGFQVENGPIFDPRSKYLAVGFHEQLSGVTDESVPQSAAAVSNSEVYQIHSTLSVHDGKASLTAARAAMKAAYGTLDAALAADLTLGGLVMLARLSGFSVNQFVNEGGSEARALITVSVRATK